MTKPVYEPVSRAKFEDLKDSFRTDSRNKLAADIRSLFDDDYEGESVYLKKNDTLALADRLQDAQNEGETGPNDWAMSDWVEMLDSLTE